MTEADRHVPVLLGAKDNTDIGVIGPERETRLLALWHFKLINFLNRLFITVKSPLKEVAGLGVPLRS